jgi:hypothetical protein
MAIRHYSVRQLGRLVETEDDEEAGARLKSSEVVSALRPKFSE